MKKSAILLFDGTVAWYENAVDMITEAIHQGGNVLAFYMGGAAGPAQAATATKEQQDLILAFGFKCLSQA